jgi:hypothetical protein
MMAISPFITCPCFYLTSPEPSSTTFHPPKSMTRTTWLGFSGETSKHICAPQKVLGSPELPAEAE